MSNRKTHKDVEYAVNDASGKERIFKTFDEAAGFAVAIGASHGRVVNLDVLVWSKAGARFYGGDEAEEEYYGRTRHPSGTYSDSDVDSVFDRFEIKVNAVGRVS